MRKIKEGLIRISDELTISPGFMFDQFKKSKFYKNQDGIRIIYLDGQHIIENRKYLISLFFKNERIYLVSLMCCDKEYSEKTEHERKILHDDILKELKIVNGERYDWGVISSDYDAKSNISSINIIYF